MADAAFLIRGRVQGVGFRWWTRSRARALGLAGSVRNRADGSVEVQVSGEPADIARLEHELRRGPPGAQVEAVDPIPAARGASRTDFEIVR